MNNNLVNYFGDLGGYLAPLLYLSLNTGLPPLESLYHWNRLRCSARGGVSLILQLDPDLSPHSFRLVTAQMSTV